MWATQQTCRGSAPCGASNNPSQPEAGSSDRKTHGDESPHEANDLLATADADDRPQGSVAVNRLVKSRLLKLQLFSTKL